MSKPYITCPKCGSHLDHGERCDCEDHMELEPSKKDADLAIQPATINEHEFMQLFLPGA